MHIISGLKKRCLAPSTAPAAAIEEAPTMSSAKMPTAKEMTYGTGLGDNYCYC